MPAHTRARGPGRGCTASSALAAAAFLALPAASAPAQTGGTPSAPKPRITWVSCPTGCDEFEPGRAGDTVTIAGRWLEAVSSVVFLGGAGTADDVAARPLNATSRRLRVTIPRRARSGPVALLGADGSSSRPSRSAVTLGTRGPLGLPRPLASGPLTAQLAGRAAFYDGRRPAQLTYTLRGAGPTDVRVDLVRDSDGTVVARWGPTAVSPNAPQVVTWNGQGGAGVPADGRYRFDVFTGSAVAVAAPVGAVASQSVPPTLTDSFLFLTHVFPVRGRHDYGTNVNRFGPISGRGHRGQDVLAACGTPLVAARGGRVKVNSFQGAAGNYLVIDEAGSRFDHAYLHLRERGLVREGERVRTGQLIGYVGTTGSSTACHLHFELWDGPWWDGGRPIDPLPSLRAWDRASALALKAGRGR
jgi:hypothetical protein